MNIAAYCRVSTDKEDQLNSLEAQKEFFMEYTKRTGDNLIKLYADEGISGTKIKNRKEFLCMLRDAEQGLFDMVVVKDISRFARNTVDLLQSVRKLKALGIETVFLTANMTSMGNSEFVLTIFGALAQEESANTSKRVKFGKKINAEKGRVPNIVFGYDKTIGDYFNLTINKEEAKVVRQMFAWYVEGGMGCAKIANRLNEQGITTKRNCSWSQASVRRILNNELYTGRIINGKEEVADFLTGQRKGKDESEWMITVRPELRIVEDEIFDKVQEILHGRHEAFHITHERQSNKYLFSTLIKCKDCGWSFRRTVHHYKNTYIRWVCSGHNGRGADSCPNAVTVDEEELIQTLQEYFQEVLGNKKKITDYVVREFRRVYKAKDENIEYEKELTAELTRLQKAREKYMDMYTDDLITREELNAKIGGMRKEIERLETELKMVSYNLTKGDQLEAILNSTFKQLEDIADVHEMTNTQLKKLLKKIEVDKDGNVDIYMRLVGDLGLDENVLIDAGESEESASPKCIDRT
ncbi:MAG: recombinase family protein [Lachnospiraceae bacterium]|nr:recombinase family protein [Lachnospiraceae bacterium]